MTEEEAVKELEECEYYDTEGKHVQYDDILVKFLRAQGYAKIADKFEESSGDFWYA